MFSNILMTVDFDRTLTATDGSIPQRNIDAIRYFMEHGGTFTVNTGRSYVSFLRFLNIVPHNAPLILMNGSASYENGEFVDVQYLPVEVWPTAQKVAAQFPGVNMEFQNPDMHYLVSPSESYAAYYKESGFPHELADPNLHRGPFVKIGVYGDISGKNIANEQEEKPLFDQVEAFLNQEFGDKLVVFRATPRIINVHAKSASKLMAAKKLQQKLGKKILVCVGDEGNDIPMLQGADYAFCPSDGAVADQFANVCPCGEGAIADVIYNRLPEILKG